MHLIQRTKLVYNSKVNRGSFSQLILQRTKISLNKNDDFEYIQRSKIPTMHFQPSLPRLPIPKLEDTCRRYLNAQKPLLSEDQFQKTESYVKEFLQTDGPILQKELKLIDSKNQHTSYISEPWFDMYLRDRKQLPINYNPALIFTPEKHFKYDDQLVKATNLIVSSLRFLKSLRAGILEPEVFHLNPKKSNTKLFRTVTRLLPSSVSWYGAYMFNAYPLDMSQYSNLFNTTRIPILDKDKISQDTSARHLIVLRQGHFYKFDVLDENGLIINPKQIAANLKHILSDTKQFNENSIGIFTASERNNWASIRNRLIEVYNKETLEKIDSAVFTLILDDKSVGTDYNNLVRTYLHGDASNRWFDKSFSLIVTKDGYAGLNFEHSWGDGVAVLRYLQDVKKDIDDKPAFHPDDIKYSMSNVIAKVENLKFKIDTHMQSTILDESSKFKKWTDGLDLNHLIYEGFGKDDCKKYGISPDAMMQLSFQLALYKQEQRSVATYESCSTAAFKHGRTETIRPCTMQTKTFCSKMIKKSAKESMPELKKMIIDCSKAHGQLTKEAAMGQGFDRHMFILNKISMELHSRQPSIFKDPAFSAMNYNILSTSTLSSPDVMAGGFGPVVKDGYGIAYMIQDKKLGAVVTCYKDYRSATEYIENLQSSITDIIRVLSSH